MELSVRPLAGEIARTTKQVKGLENIVLPRLHEEAGRIVLTLDEREREEHARLRRARTRRTSRDASRDRPDGLARGMNRVWGRRGRAAGAGAERAAPDPATAHQMVRDLERSIAARLAALGEDDDEVAAPGREASGAVVGPLHQARREPAPMGAPMQVATEPRGRFLRHSSGPARFRRSVIAALGASDAETGSGVDGGTRISPVWPRDGRRANPTAGAG